MLPPPAPISMRSTAGRLEKQAAAFLEASHARHLELGGARRLAAGDQRDLGGRAAHVEGEDVGRAEPLGEMGGDRDAGSGPGLDQPDRELAGKVEAQRAAAGAHHEEGAARAPLLQGLARARPDSATSAAERRRWPPWWRRGRTRRSPAARARTATRRDRAARPGWPVPRPPRWPGWRRRAGSRRRRPRRPRPSSARTASRTSASASGVRTLPVEAHALGNADAPMTRHQGLGEFDEQIVQVVAKLGAGLERIAKAARGEQRRACALALDDGVGRQGRAVHDGADRVVTRLGLLEHLRDRRQHGLRRAAPAWSAPWPNRRCRLAHRRGSRR